MTDPTGPELAQIIRDSFPERDRDEFESDLALFRSDSAEQYSRCAVLMAFSWQFNRWVEAGHVEPIRRALALVDQFLASTPPVPEGTHPDAVGDHFHNSLLACFVEDILKPTDGFRSLVRPNFGAAVRAHLRRYEPWWLEAS